jgi:cleavage stimulation factor subunit 2
MSVEEKQARSVFVGNIPHGTSEDQMKEIFTVIGPVLSFRIVLDRETGNPKGYGFAEYAGKCTSSIPAYQAFRDACS